MIVGPPGTGKTDTAVQIISNLYHNFPSQRILLITHSNAALNDLFEKIMNRNIDGRHLLRLGSGEYDLRNNLDGDKFNKNGRVQWCLDRRLELLTEIQRLANSMNIFVGDVGYTCETAEYYYEYTLKPILIDYENKLLEIEKSHFNNNNDNNNVVNNTFPFHNYFSNIPNLPLFNDNIESDIFIARGCLTHIHHIFQELSDYRPFELLRTQGHRCDYMLMKQVKFNFFSSIFFF